MRKVCFVLTGMYPLFNEANNQQVHGGAEVQFYQLATKLVQQPDWQVSVITGNYGQSNLEIKNGITIIGTLPIKTHNPLSKLLKQLKLLKALHQANADIYITTTNNPLAGTVNLYCRWFKKKHVHRLAHIDDLPAHNWLYRQALLHANVIIAQTKDQQDKLSRLYEIDSLLLPNSYNIKPLTKHERQHILWVARATRWKQPEKFMLLAQAFPLQQFVMICPATEDDHAYQKALKQHAAKIPNLKFIDFVPYEEIQQYFDQAIVFINTSTNEGFPNTFLQAMQAATPILSWQFDPDKIIQTHQLGGVAGGEDAKLISLLRQLLRNETMRANLGQNGYEYLINNHDILKNVQKLATKLNQL